MVDSVQLFRAGAPEVIGVGVDLRMSEIHQASAQIARQVLEDGSQLSDHIILNPDVVEITAEVSNIDDAPGTLGERARTSWLRLKQELQSQQLFDVVTAHENYTRMGLAFITGEHTAPYRGRLVMRIGFERADSTQPLLTETPESRLSNDVAKGASSLVDAGRQLAITVLDDPDLVNSVFDAIEAGVNAICN